MNDDYLWDKSGEPDRQVQELEEILGVLRYQPRPLKLAPRRNYLALLAIAATVVVALVSGGLWLLTRTSDPSIPFVAIETAPLTSPKLNPRLSAASQPLAKRKPVVVTAKHDRGEALAAKQQLMFALRVASEKLNDAYRRTQTPSQIKNQHRAG